MSEKYILSLDQGTTSSRAIVFDGKGNIVRKAQREFRQIYPKAGWVEHDPEDILSTSIDVMKQASNGLEIAAVGIANQRETVVVWDRKSGKPVYNAIVWQCRRTAGECTRLIEEGYEDLIYERTGLTPDAYFSATKIKWILSNVSGARERAERGELLFGTVDSFLLWHLSGGKAHCTDYTNASRTMLYNIHRLCWDHDLLQIFGVPENMLPEVKPSSGEYATVEKSLPCCGAVIAALVGDQQAALFGQLCTERGQSKSTYGTGCFLLTNTGSEPIVSRRGLLTTLAASGKDGRPDYALEGSVFTGGAVIQWLRDEMGLITTAAQSETLAKSVDDTLGVYIVPAFAGLGAPYWDSIARGAVCGLTRGVKREHFVRAALESIAYQVFDLVHATERDLGRKITSLSVDGGASANDFLMQFQADVLGSEVVRPRVIETTALGAAYLAGMAVGFYGDISSIKSDVKEERVFSPSIDETKREALIEGWTHAVARARLKF